ncbi:MAG TPA: hypothetical protein VJ987_07705 [Anaerolineales bacterium]|nr:hypothetical protein [Anaerolineales bacterium]
MKNITNNQPSLFDYTPPPAVAATPVQSLKGSGSSSEDASLPAPEERGEEVLTRLQTYWSNSQDLAFCTVNVLLHSDQFLFAFVEYVKACRLAEVTGEVQKPTPHRRFDRLAECLKRLDFTLEERGEKGEVILTETTVLDFAVDVSFDEEELRELRAFGVAGASTRQVEELAEAIRNYVEEATKGQDEVPTHPYIEMLRRLGIPEESMPEASDKEAVLKAMLAGIGESIDRFDSVISSTDITPQELLAAGGPAQRKQLNKMLAQKLVHELAGFSGSTQWYRHAGFWRNEILLTEGAMHLAEHGGRNFGSAFWFMDVIASYQGEKKLVRQPFQVWKFVADPPGEDGTWNSGRVVCENGNDKVIVEQVIEYTDFLLENITVYASYEPVDETGRKKRTIILLTSEY